MGENILEEITCEKCGYSMEDCTCTCPYCGETTLCECCIGTSVTGG